VEMLRDILELGGDPKKRPPDVKLDGDLVDKVDEAVEAELADGGGGRLLSMINPLVQGKDAREVDLYAAAYVQATSGDVNVARALFTHLSERLEQQERWDTLGPVLDRALRLVGTPELARVAARLWEKGGSEHAPLPLLEQAFSLSSEDYRVLWSHGFSLMEAGEKERGLSLVAKSLVGFARRKEAARVEEGFLQILEDPSKGILHDGLHALDQLVRTGATESAVALFELALEPFVDHKLAWETWSVLRRTLERAPEEKAFRRVAAAAGVAAHSNVRNPDTLFQRAGIADPAVPLPDALSTLDQLLEVPPGRHVLHQGWGVGEVLDNDGENLTIRFEERSRHRMSISLAKSALQLLAPTDIRVKVFNDRDGMMGALQENRAEFLFHTLEHLGGEATQNDVRKLLLSLGLLTTSNWSEWWNKAKKEAAGDGRFDFSRAFQKVVRLQGERNLVSSLPEVDLADGFRKGLDLLYRFLDQHPEEIEHLAQRYGGQLQSLAGEKGRNPSGRVQAHLLLRKVGLTDEEGFAAAVDDFVRSPDLAPFTSEQEKGLLAAAPEGKEGAVASVLLDSRVLGVRREAWRILSEVGGEELERAAVSTLASSPHRGNALLHVCRELAGEEGRSPWSLIHALIHVVEDPERDPHRRQALEILASPAMQEKLAAFEPSPEESGYLRNRLLNWRHSERYLFPILEALEKSTLRSLAEEVEEKRRSLRPQANGSLQDRFGDKILMTRATLTRLQKEAETLDWDLKTTIPQEIRKAREHGDLRENAEYDAAKQKQADTSKRLEEMYNRLRSAKAIEEIEVPEGVVWPGTEVVLRSEGGEELVYWMLGEGDQALGERVLSYRAPLAEGLLGKGVGEEVGPIDGATYRIAEIRKRLP